MPNTVQIGVFWLVQVSALLMFAVPFRWAFVALWAASHFIRALGLTLIFHRYLAHRAFQMNRVARFVWALIGTAAMQKGPLWWAGHHVNHHRYADRDGDPHSPSVSGFYYAHIGWFLNDTRHDQLPPSNPVIRDFSKDFEIAWLERFFVVPPLLLAIAMFLAGGFPWLVWGFCVPTVTLAHSTFAINTVNHMFGSRRFETHDASRNNLFTAVFRRRRRVAQQPSPLSARGAQRVLLVGVRSDLVRHPRHGGGRSGVGDSVGPDAHLRGSAGGESGTRGEAGLQRGRRRAAGAGAGAGRRAAVALRAATSADSNVGDQRQMIRGDLGEPRARQLDVEYLDLAGVVDVIEVQERKHPRVGPAS